MWGDLVGHIRRGLDDVVEVWNEVDAEIEQSELDDHGELTNIKKLCGLSNGHDDQVSGKRAPTLTSASDASLSGDDDEPRSSRRIESSGSSPSPTSRDAVADVVPAEHERPIQVDTSASHHTDDAKNDHADDGPLVADHGLASPDEGVVQHPTRRSQARR